MFNKLRHFTKTKFEKKEGKKATSNEFNEAPARATYGVNVTLPFQGDLDMGGRNGILLCKYLMVELCLTLHKGVSTQPASQWKFINWTFFTPRMPTFDFKLDYFSFIFKVRSL